MYVAAVASSFSRSVPRPWWAAAVSSTSFSYAATELYFRQDGTEPVEPLITASSKVTKKNEPLAWTYHYGKGRIFQTLLGHSEKTYDSFAATEMLRRRQIHEYRKEDIIQLLIHF